MYSSLTHPLRSGEPLHIHTDGSYHKATGSYAYGWVALNPPSSFPTVKVVQEDRSRENRKTRHSTYAETSAAISALDEFAILGRPLVIHTDCTVLPLLVEKYRRGEIATPYFFSPERKHIESDEWAWKLVRRLSAPFTFEWEKAHSTSFPNLVIDQALRLSHTKGKAVAEEFARTALATGRASVWGARPTWDEEIRSVNYTAGYRTVAWAA